MPNPEAYFFKAYHQKQYAEKARRLAEKAKNVPLEEKPSINRYRLMLRISAQISEINKSTVEYDDHVKEQIAKLKRQVQTLHLDLFPHDKSCVACENPDFLIYQNTVSYEELLENERLTYVTKL